MKPLALRAPRSIGVEQPFAALVQIALAPLVCTLTLFGCTVIQGQAFTMPYQVLAICVFLVSTQAFGHVSLSSGRARNPLLMPNRTLMAEWLLVVGILLLLGFATKLSGLYSRRVILTWFASTPLALHAASEMARTVLAGYLRAAGRPRLKVMVGANETACDLATAIRRDPSRGMVLGYFDDRDERRARGRCPGERLGAIEDVVDYVKRNGVHVVYITLPYVGDPRILRLLRELRDTTASIYIVPSAPPLELIQARVDLIGGIPAIAVCETPFYGVDAILKRMADVAIAACALLVCGPLMGAIALGVRLTSPGPVLFRQKRYGLDGGEIVVYKFRTMHVCEDGERVTQAVRNDPRVTRFGAFLRRTSLDELPQLFNVLQGRMSIVGPRPHAVAHNEQYRGLIEGYMLRHKVRPGITGWAQINGYRGETSDVGLMRKRVEYDLEYLKHWSLSLDLWIILRTVGAVLKGRHAY
jgi:putative colanic acid biosynthesis UDP-glucose lipid carrier transferase